MLVRSGAASLTMLNTSASAHSGRAEGSIHVKVSHRACSTPGLRTRWRRSSRDIYDSTHTSRHGRCPMDLGFQPIDADNHYYEAVDACTRHLPKEFSRRGVRVVQEGKKTLVLHADKVSYFIPNPTFDPIIVPGCLDLMFRGQVPEGVNPRELTKVEPLKAEYRDRDRRLAVMDDQGLER